MCPKWVVMCGHVVLAARFRNRGRKSWGSESSRGFPLVSALVHGVTIGQQALQQNVYSRTSASNHGSMMLQRSLTCARPPASQPWMRVQTHRASQVRWPGLLWARTAPASCVPEHSGLWLFATSNCIHSTSSCGCAPGPWPTCLLVRQLISCLTPCHDASHR